MNKIPTVQELRQLGYKVRINHYRLCELDKNQNIRIMYPLKAIRAMRTVQNPHIVSPRGGMTMINLYHPVKSKEYTAIARCHENDVFRKDNAIRICLSRIMAEVSL